MHMNYDRIITDRGTGAELRYEYDTTRSNCGMVELGNVNIRTKEGLRVNIDRLSSNYVDRLFSKLAKRLFEGRGKESGLHAMYLISDALHGEYAHFAEDEDNEWRLRNNSPISTSHFIDFLLDQYPNNCTASPWVMNPNSGNVQRAIIFWAGECDTAIESGGSYQFFEQELMQIGGVANNTNLRVYVACEDEDEEW